MMKKIISLIYVKTISLLPVLALTLAVASVNSICFYITHQPDVPRELSKNIK